MRIRTEHQARAFVVSVSGRIDAGNAREFEVAMDGVLDQGGRALILDCAELTYVSSVGLRVLLKVTRELERRRVPLVICSLSRSISEVFRISGFDKIIPICDSRAEALATVPR